MSRLADRWVHVVHPETGEVIGFAPGSEPDSWAVPLITNPKAWASDEDAPPEDHQSDAHDDQDSTTDVEPTGDDESQTDESTTTDDNPSDDEDSDDSDENSDTEGDEDSDVTDETVEKPPAPPRAGKGSSTDAWREYADALGYSVEASMSKKDIIAALEADGALEAE